MAARSIYLDGKYQAKNAAWQSKVRVEGPAGPSDAAEKSPSAVDHL
jgi:hypothetical protein